MPTLKEMFPVRYFRGADLNGQPLVLTVTDVSEELIFNEYEWVCWFAEDARGLRLKTRDADRLAVWSRSENTDDWCGLRVQLVPRPFTTRDGKNAIAIVLEPAPPAPDAAPFTAGKPPAAKPLPPAKQKAKPPLRDAMDDDIPF